MRCSGSKGPSGSPREWWKRKDGAVDQAGLTRDYYRVEDARGRRFWVFRHGLYEEKPRPQLVSARAVRMTGVRRTGRRDQLSASCAAPRIPATWSAGRWSWAWPASASPTATASPAWCAPGSRSTTRCEQAEAALRGDRFQAGRRRAAGVRRRDAGHRRLSGDAPRLGPADPAADRRQSPGGEGRLHPPFRRSARSCRRSAADRHGRRGPGVPAAPPRRGAGRARSGSARPCREHGSDRRRLARAQAAGGARSAFRCSPPTTRSMPRPTTARCTTSSPASARA